MAELADALASGASPGNRVQVQVLSSAVGSQFSRDFEVAGYTMERWTAALVLCLIVGCAPARTDAPVTGASPAAPISSAADATGGANADAPAEGFWKGLERHEIQLDQTLLLVKGSRGVAACPYLNVDSFAKTGEACAIIPAVNIDGMLDSKVTAVTPKARELGIEVGMPGREALDKIR